MNSYRKRVLIVDGHEEVLISLEKLLEDNGYCTTTSWTATDALRFLRSWDYDMILVSEYLPDGTFEDLLRAARKRNADTQCIVMQGNAKGMRSDDRFKILGASAVVCKYEQHSILDTLRRIMSPAWKRDTSVA